MSNNGDRAAFPTVEDSPHGGTYVSEYGMTQRQYYKAQALAGLLANPSTDLRECASEGMAKFIGRVADLMLAEDAQHANSL